MPADPSQLLPAAEGAVERACKALVAGRAKVRALIDKGDYGFATVVDVEVEELVREHLRRETPGIPFLGEEEGGEGLMMRRSMRLRLHGSVALDLAWLAAGRMSAAIALSNLPWDVGAGVLLVREAGGVVFDESGGLYGPQSSSTLASVPAMRETIVSVITAARDSRSRQQSGASAAPPHHAR